MLAPDPTPAAIRVSHLGKTYEGARKFTVFADMSFEVRQGERLAVIGESGSGKSTLLHLLGGLDRPTAGTIHYANPQGQSTDLTALSPSALAAFRNRELGFVWQVQSLLPEFSALENIQFPLLIRGISPQDSLARSQEMLAAVGLADRAHNLAGELSGGEQQRVSLARALAGQPRFLLADEPTGNLDETTATQILDLLERLQSQYGLTSVIVTHSPALAARCHRTLRLAKGGLFEITTSSPIPWPTQPTGQPGQSRPQ